MWTPDDRRNIEILERLPRLQTISNDDISKGGVRWSKTWGKIITKSQNNWKFYEIWERYLYIISYV